MSAYLWKVTAKKQLNKLPAGANVEIVKSGTNAKPSQKEINEAFNAKYGVDGGSLATSYYDIVLMQIMEASKQLEVKYDAWIDKAIKLMVEVASQNNMAASSMQSPMIFDNQVDVVFLGHDANEPFGFDGNIEKIKNRFKDGNPYWKYRYSDPKWKIWRNMYKGFADYGDTSLLDNEKRYIFTNAVFLTGSKIDLVNSKVGNAVNICMEYTSELIFEIIKPKVLVCFSIDSVLEPLSNNSKERFDFKIKRFRPVNSKYCFTLAEYKGVRIAGVPHISGAYGVLGSVKAVAEYIMICLTAKTTDDIVKYYKESKSQQKANCKTIINQKEKRTRTQKKATFNYKKLIELLREEIPDIDKYKENEKTHRIAVGKNSVMKLTVSTVQGTIGIRLASVTSNNKWVTGNMDFLLPSLKNLNWNRETELPERWFVKLDYKGKTEEEIREIIIKTRDYLKDKEFDIA